MAKKKVQTITLDYMNGSRLKEPIKIPVYYDGYFFCYVDESISNIIEERHKKLRIEGRSFSDRKSIYVLSEDSPEKIKDLLYKYYKIYYEGNIIEEKIIHYKLKFNSKKHYFNHSDNMGSADTPALSFKWNMLYLVTFPDGRQKIFSDPFKTYGSLCSNSKFDKPIGDFKGKWMMWTEERELFFKGTEDAMENMIEKIQSFFNQPKNEIEENIDKNTKLLS